MQRKCILTQVYENFSWDYLDAIAWMQQARERCVKDGCFTIGLGSHAQNGVTLGRHAKSSEIIDAHFLSANAVSIVNVDRGGGATIHGPGQVVLYPIFSLELLKLSVPKATFLMEESIVQCLKELGISSHRTQKEPGVYVEKQKIGSVGFRVKDQVITHGISLNVSNDLSLYSKIRTCGKANAAITSIAALLGEKMDVPSVGRMLMKNFKSNLDSL